MADAGLAIIVVQHVDLDAAGSLTRAPTVMTVHPRGARGVLGSRRD